MLQERSSVIGATQAPAVAAQSRAAHLTHPKYRPDIDGLRAVAVLSVVIFHAFPSAIQGGFVGVDVFFVISGYLISTIIFGSLTKGAFTFGEFYARRVKRIFPSLLTVLIACAVFGWFALLPDEFSQLGKHIAGGAGFIANLLLWNESGYFDNAAATKPLLHLWSLGIEEQFYFVWPIVLWVCHRRGLSFLKVAAVLGAASFALNVYLVGADATDAFYSPASRFWELLAGGVLAYLTLQGKIPSEGRGANARSVVGAALLVAALALTTEDKAFPGWWAVLPVLGTALLISAGPDAIVNRLVLSRRVMVWVGMISFPLYLWHWPLLSFARIIDGGMPDATTRAVAALLAVALAWLTYRLVERPLRFGTRGLARTDVLLGAMALAAAAGALTFTRGGFESRVPELGEISKATGPWPYPGTMQEFQYEGHDLYSLPSAHKQTTLFIGDSNLEQYYVRIEQLVKDRPQATRSAIFATGSNCIPVPGLRNDKFAHCLGLIEHAADLALARPEVSTVVISGQWLGYFGAPISYTFEDGISLPVKIGAPGYTKALAALSDTIQELRQAGKRVILVLNIPVGEALDPRQTIHRQLSSFPNMIAPRDGGMELAPFLAKYGQIRSDLTKVARQSGAEVIDPVEYLCADGKCPNITPEGMPMYRDFAHLNPNYVRDNATFIDRAVLLP